MAVNGLVVRFLYRHERIDRVVEGKATTLIENGQVLKDNLDSELITVAELEAAAHRQGYETLEAVDRAILEPGGNLVFYGRKPTGTAIRQHELVAHLEEIKQLDPRESVAGVSPAQLPSIVTGPLTVEMRTTTGSGPKRMLLDRSSQSRLPLRHAARRQVHGELNDDEISTPEP